MATVDMSSLTPNSNKYKQEQEEKKDREKTQLVIKEEDVVTVKTPVAKKIAGAFIEEGIQDIKRYIINDVIIPGIKDTFMNMMSIAFYGDVIDDYGRRPKRKRNKDYYTDYSSYSSSYRSNERRSRRRYDDDEEDIKTDYRNIVLRTRNAAEDVVDELKDRIRKNGDVSVAELLEMVNAPSDFVDNNWGWDDERDISIRRISSGWLINVREARYLK